MPKRIKWDMQKMYDYCKEHNLDLPSDNQDYTTMKGFYLYNCSKHNYVYKQRWQQHLMGSVGCKYCQFENPNIKRKKDIKYYYDECLNKDVDTPLLNQEYKGNAKKLYHECKNGHIYLQCPSSNLRGIGCPECNKVTLNNYYKEWSSLNLDLPLSINKNIDINCKSIIEFKCKKGHTYKQPVNQHKFYGCPICNESHGEKYIRNYLDKNHIKYIPQKKFHDLKDKTYLSYDYYLPEYNMLIEYQGIQHYESVSFNGKDYTDLEKQQLHDNLKREYAKENGYKLLELKYTLDTQELIDKYLERRIKINP